MRKDAGKKSESLTNFFTRFFLNFNSFFLLFLLRHENEIRLPVGNYVFLLVYYLNKMKEKHTWVSFWIKKRIKGKGKK